MVYDIKTKEKFFQDIRSIVNKKGTSYLEAVVIYCEEYDIEVETVSTLIKKNELLRAKIEEEAENLNLIEKSDKLPI